MGACADLDPPTAPPTTLDAEALAGLTAVSPRFAAPALPALELPPDLLPGEYGCMARRAVLVDGSMQYESRFFRMEALDSMARAAGDENTKLRFLQHSATGTLILEGYCIAPASEEAAAYVLAYFGKGENYEGAGLLGVVDGPGSKMNLGTITPLGETCEWEWDESLGEFVCVFPPIVVNPPSDCDPLLDPYFCHCEEMTSVPGKIAGVVKPAAGYFGCPGGGGGGGGWDDDPWPGDPGPGDGDPGGGGGPGDDTPPGECEDPIVPIQSISSISGRGRPGGQSGGGRQAARQSGRFETASSDCPPPEDCYTLANPGSHAITLGGCIDLDFSQEQICAILNTDKGVSCSIMDSTFASRIIQLFADSGFRSTDPECQQMKSVMNDIIDFQKRGNTGLPPAGTNYGGLSVFSKELSAPIAVWFNKHLFSYSVEEQQRVVGHEAYHLAYLDDSDESEGENGRANQAARYCFSQSSHRPPFWP